MIELYGVMIIEDRYTGSYAPGRWLAIDEADTAGRIEAVDNGPLGSDPDALMFWDDPPDWIAGGATPNDALAALEAKREPRRA